MLALGSLPVWGEWIEIGFGFSARPGDRRSLPVWGEWIEIARTVLPDQNDLVSPRVGRVD